MSIIAVLSGLDPSGGAGITADIETINQFGLTSLPIITNLTTQNTKSVKSLKEVDSDLITSQFRYLEEDIEFKVVKIGLLSSIKQIKAIAKLVNNKTVVMDPVISPSKGNIFYDKATIKALKTILIPMCKIITPNIQELYYLSEQKNEQKAIDNINCKWILLTTTDVSSDMINHRLYCDSKLTKTFSYKKLAGNYHGSGCTLSSAISALIALKFNIELACEKALEYTYKTLLNAKKIGKSQLHPNRIKI